MVRSKSPMCWHFQAVLYSRFFLRQLFKVPFLLIFHLYSHAFQLFFLAKFQLNKTNGRHQSTGLKPFGPLPSQLPRRSPVTDKGKQLQHEKDTEISPLLAECSWRRIVDG